MVYDSARGVVLLFGGGTISGLVGDTWVWDGVTWNLRSTTGPLARSRPGLTFDTERNVAVIFGGSSNHFLGDTWEWDGETWTECTQESPPARELHAMFYDEERRASVMFGGNGIMAGSVGDTWVYERVCDPPDAPALEVSAVAKNRYLSSVLGKPGCLTALKVTLVDLQNPNPSNVPQNPPPDFSGFESATCTATGEANGCARWVGKPSVFLESQNIPGLGSFVGARLQCTPLYYDFAAQGLFHVTGAEIVPSSSYEVMNFGPSCMGNEDACVAVSPPLTLYTGRYGDIVAPFSTPGKTTQPDGTDIVKLVDKFKSVPGAPGKPITLLQPNLPDLNGDVSGSDIVQCVDAFKQFAYPFSGPCPCPSLSVCGALPCPEGPGACIGSSFPGLGAEAICIKTCLGGDNDGDPCLNNAHCPGGACGQPFCRDRCGRCTP